MDLKLFARNGLLKFSMLILLLAVVTEAVQLWVPSRSFSVMDWISNVAGFLAGVGLIGWKMEDGRRKMEDGRFKC